MEITVWLRLAAFAALVAWLFFLLRERKLLSCEWLRWQFRHSFLEVYFIPGKGIVGELVGAHTDYGIIVKNAANARTLAHEIGHACGWTDIYIRKNSDTPIPTELQHRVRPNWLPSDWSGGVAGGFYERDLQQYELIPRLLMYGVRSGIKADIPLGSVYGLPKLGDLGNMNVGLDIFLQLHRQVSK